MHLRDEKMLENIAYDSTKSFSGAIIMPNLVPPVTTKEMVVAYKQRIKKAIKDNKFEPMMTLFFKDSYTKEFLEDKIKHKNNTDYESPLKDNIDRIQKLIGVSLN